MIVLMLDILRWRGILKRKTGFVVDTVLFLDLSDCHQQRQTGVDLACSAGSGVAQLLFKKVCAGGGNTLVGVRGGEGAESEHVEEDEGRESVGETGDASSASSAAWDGLAGLTSRTGSSSATSRFNPNSDDKSLMNAQYLSAGNAYGCDWMKVLISSS